MKQAVLFTGLAFFAMLHVAQGQNIGFDIIDESRVEEWPAAQPADYQGLYRFGESEGESTLIVVYTGQGFVAQIRTSDWREEERAWVFIYHNLQQVKVIHDLFISQDYKGLFVTYRGQEGPRPGLKIDNPWSGIPEAGDYEIGLRTSADLTDYFAGEYIQGSTKLLAPADLARLSAQALRIMRNEIFARYGYTFRAGGAMETYFQQQDWYQASYTKVDDFLTELERANIQTIVAEEQRRN